MNFKLFVAISTVLIPALAQAQPGGQKAAKPTPADVQRVSKMIGADKAKTQVYCEMAKLDEEIAKAEDAKDTKKAEELSKKSDEMAQKLGPEYTKLMAGLEQVNPESAEGKKLAAAFEQFEKLCPNR